MPGFLPLPDRPVPGGEEAFRHCTAQLLRLLGVEPEPIPFGRRRVRTALPGAAGGHRRRGRGLARSVEDPLVARVISIARAHPDPYVRHRVEVQLGG